MRKLRAIWNIIKANKWAVFTYEEAPMILNGLHSHFFDGMYQRKIWAFFDL